MSLAHKLRSQMALPVIGAPMFIVSNPDLVIAQCTSGVVGAFPALNARPAEALETWIEKIQSALDQHRRAHPGHKIAPFAVTRSSIRPTIGSSTTSRYAYAIAFRSSLPACAPPLTWSKAFTRTAVSSSTT